MEKEMMIYELKKKITTLEWDKQLGQTKFSKGKLLEDFKNQLSELEGEPINEEII